MNEFLNASMFANVMLLLLKNQLVFGRRVSSQFINQLTDENGLKVSIKRPPRFIAKTGAALAAQDIIVGNVDLEVTEYRNVHIAVGDLEWIQSMNQLMQDETVLSAASTLAHDVDSFLAEKTTEFFSEVGVPGNIIGSPAEFNKAHTRLMDQSVPNSNLSGVVSFADGEEIRGSLIGGDIRGVNRTALERTRIPILSEVDLFASNNLFQLTNGTRAGTPLVNGANQNVNYRAVKSSVSQNLVLDGLGANETVKKGEVLTIAGVNALNPASKNDLGRLQEFTVMADATADGLGNITLAIFPWIIVPGTNDGTSTDANNAFGTVSAIPADNAAVTFFGAAGSVRDVRSVFHKGAIQLATARLRMPDTGEAAFRVDPETNIGIRVWKGSDISTGQHIWRFDMVFGATTVDPFRGTRINGQ